MVEVASLSLFEKDRIHYSMLDVGRSMFISFYFDQTGRSPASGWANTRNHEQVIDRRNPVWYDLAEICHSRVQVKLYGSYRLVAGDKKE